MGSKVGHHTSDRLGTTAARGVLQVLTGQAGRVLVQVLGIVLLARLLSPEDYGLLAMVTVLIGLGEILRDFGLSSAVIQAKSVTKHQRNNLFWINCAMGVTLSAGAFAAAPLIGAFYHEPRVVPIVQALSSIFLLNSLSAQYRAHLNRDLRFGALATADVVGPAIGLAVGIAAALLGMNYWSLVFQQLTSSFSVLVMLVVWGSWIPGLPKKSADVKPFLRFGWNLMLTQMIGFIANNLDKTIIGRQQNAEVLGIYDRAFQILQLPLSKINAPATQVALPVLSKLQSHKQEYDKYILRGQTVLIHAVALTLSLAAINANALVQLALGDQWDAAVEIFQLLAIGGLFQAAAYPSYWVFLTKGLTGSNLRYSIISRIIFIAVILAGSSFGIVGVAIAYSIGQALLWPLSLWWVGRISDAPVWAIFTNGFRCIALYLFCGVSGHFFPALIGISDPTTQIVVTNAYVIILLTVAVLGVRSYRTDAGSILHTLRLMLARRK